MYYVIAVPVLVAVTHIDNTEIPRGVHGLPDEMIAGVDDSGHLDRAACHNVRSQMPSLTDMSQSWLVTGGCRPAGQSGWLVIVTAKVVRKGNPSKARLAYMIYQNRKIHSELRALHRWQVDTM